MMPIIEGDDNFEAKTLEALYLIQYKSSENYNMVIKYVGRIKQGQQSGMAAYENPPTYYVGKATYSSKRDWYASTIVHDAYHSKLYHDYIQSHGWVPNDIWTGEKAEYACLEIQISFLEEIQADIQLITSAKSFRKSRWWEDQFKEKYGHW